ncbi:MarR family transcriptional regulator [bacterium]|nr:MarR family transcriptional regulator [bacterium]
MTVTLEQDFHESIGHWICMTSRMVERAMNAELEPEGITFRQAQVLAWMALDGGGLSQVELAERMNIEPATLVSVLDRMARDGWIERVACQEDRRRNLVHPMPKALPAWQKILACAGRVRTRAARGLTHEQQETLKELLGIVQANLKCPAKDLASNS